MNDVVFNPIQTSGMPLRDKILNYCWKIINKSLFRFTPPFSNFLGNTGSGY